MIGDDRSQRQGDKRADIDRHVEEGKGTIQPRIAALIAFGEQTGRVGLEQAVADRDGTERIENQVRIVDGHAGHEIADNQYNRPQHHGALGPENMIANITTDRYKTIHQRRESAEGDKRLLLGKTQLLYKENRQDPLHAVITEALPEFDKKYHEEGFGLL